MWIYSAVLGLGLVLSAPWWLLRMVTTARYREGLGERLGRVPRRVRAAVAGRHVVWVHAVSVGEVLAVVPLVRALEVALGGSAGPTLAGEQAAGEEGAPGFAPGVERAPGAGWVVVVSTTTRTGQALARERFGTERVLYFPLDFAWAVRAYLRVLRPALVVLTESELWPRLLHECRRAGVPVAVVNARVSDRSFRRAGRVRGVWARVLGTVTLFLAQSAEDARRLVTLGADRRVVRVVGNLKYDLQAQKTEMVELLQPLLKRRVLVVGGSLLETEEQALLDGWSAVMRRDPEAVLLLAPRHPERFARVAALVGTGVTLYRASELRGAARRGDAGGRLKPCAVILLDTMGDLASVYALADAAFVGGSLVPKGGHNPLEAARFGVPVLMGPSYENFRAVVENLRAEDAIRIVAHEGELAGALQELLTERGAARAMGERGQAVFDRERGATARCVAALLPLAGVRPAVADAAVEAVSA